METSNLGQPRVFPLSRYVHYDHFRHYYAFGNSPADDFLQSVAASECRLPTVLSLGCGDLRSSMFTIFKNFGFGDDFINGFKGARFVLNDRSASVLARNILFLYLCLTMPSSNADQKEWIASMWSIWYNHELQTCHTSMLLDALQELQKWSSTWQKWSECPMGAVVQYSSPAAFATVRKVWGKWCVQCKEKSVEEMTRERNAFQCHHMTKAKIKYKTREEGLSIMATNVFMMNSAQHSLNSSEISRKIDEHIHYLTTGSVWAETVLSISLSVTKTTVNPTFYEREDGVYSLHYSLSPYMGYTSAFYYTHGAMSKTLGSKSCVLIVADQYFKPKPLLANSVQQFSMWVMATARAVKSCNRDISFLMDLGDSIELCYHLLYCPEQCFQSDLRFDVIKTSNLFDHLSPPALVVSCLPLLKPNGTLFTATFKTLVSDQSKYLEEMFGFSAEFFEVFLGVHCIGQDGDYSPAVNHEPSPTLYMTLSHSIEFSWKNVISQPLVMDSIEDSPHALKFLLALCKTCCIQGNMCIGSPESFLCVLHQFLKQLASSPTSEYFLKALATAIRNEIELKPHLVQLQTQSLLHEVHMHIILTKEDCPICQQQPLENYIQQYSLTFDIETSQFDTDEAPTFTLYFLSSSGDLVTVSSFAAVNSIDSRLKLVFYFPKHCCSQYSLLNVSAFQNLKQKYVFLGTTESLKASSMQCAFLRQLPQVFNLQLLSTSMGEIIKNIGDSSTFETIVAQGSACRKALKETSFGASCNESNTLELVCGAMKSIITYPYAIDESKVHIQISTKKSTISITVQRASSVLYEGRPIFYVDPSNKWALPSFECQPDVMDKFCNMQIHFNAEGHPLYNAKSSFAILFKDALSGEKYFTLSFESKRFIGTPDVHALVYIHDVRFSPVFASPAIDVSYCFLDTKPPSLLRGFYALHSGLGPTKNIIVDDAEYKLLKTIFKYYSAVTVCAFSTDRYTVKLPMQKHKLWKHFSNAVLFPLYPNPANPAFQKISKFMFSSSHTQESTNPFFEQLFKPNRVRGDICSFCQITESSSLVLKHCNNCQSVKYCSEECQWMHKRFHETSCKALQSTPPTEECTTLPQQSDIDSQLVSDSEQPTTKSTTNMAERQHGKASASRETTDVSKCVRCKRVATIVCRCEIASYCSKACQTLEWPEHSERCKECTAKVDSPATKKMLPRKEHKPASDILIKCSNCDRTKQSLRKCSKCHHTLYCSVECQRLHWPQHKLVCKK